jgi:hypothetical protein
LTGQTSACWTAFSSACPNSWNKTVTAWCEELWAPSRRPVRHEVGPGLVASRRFEPDRVSHHAPGSCHRGERSRCTAGVPRRDVSHDENRTSDASRTVGSSLTSTPRASRTRSNRRPGRRRTGGARSRGPSRPARRAARVAVGDPEFDPAIDRVGGEDLRITAAPSGGAAGRDERSKNS